MTQGRNVREVGAKIENLLEELRAISDAPTQAKAEELVRLLVDLYGAGLERVMEIVTEQEAAEVLGKLVEDQLLASLLVLHGLHPVPVEVRIQDALEKVRPYLGSHAGGVEYLGLDEVGAVHLRLEGSCHGCPSSTITVKLAIERAIEEAAPEVSGVEVEGVNKEQAPKLLQITMPHRDHAPPADEEGGWVRLDTVGRLLPGEMRSLEAGPVPIIVCSAGGALYVYRNACVRCGSELQGGRLQEEFLTCPSCSERYNVKLAGRSLDHDDVHLDPLPLLEDEKGLRVATPSAVGS